MIMPEKLIGNIFLHIVVQRVPRNSNIKALGASCTNAAGISVSAALKEIEGTTRCTILIIPEGIARKRLGQEKPAQLDVGLMGQHYFPQPSSTSPAEKCNWCRHCSQSTALCHNPALKFFLVQACIKTGLYKKCCVVPYINSLTFLVVER